MPYQCDPCACPEQHYRAIDTFKKAMITLLCNLRDVLLDIYGAIGGGTPPATNATFAALTPVTSIGGSYVSAVVLPTGTRAVILDNQTNGDVFVSMDGGTSDNYHMTPGEKDFLDLAALGLLTSADVQLKDGAMVSTAGTFFVYSIQ